jgi:DNA-binding NarL/FixJ family response regulator
LDLGFLNTGLNFARASDYFQIAIAVAREMNEPLALGQSLNRVGNWYMNQDQPFEALPYHQEALKIFEQLENAKELASTLDLLGVTHVVAGDMVASAQYYDRAITIFRQLDDRIGLSSSLAVNAIHGGNCMEETTYSPPVTLEYVLTTSSEAYDIAHEIGWRTGEVAADMYAGYALVLYGEYELCLETSNRALDTAQSIQHPLYYAATQMTLGRLYNEIFAFDAAQDLLNQALTVARKMNAKFLLASIAGFLASSYLGLSDKKAAVKVLNEFRGSQLSSVGQRIIRCADVELAIANRDYANALKLIDTLYMADTAENNLVVPRIYQLKAHALMGLGQVDESIELLEAAVDDLTERAMQSTLWHVLADLSHAYHLSGDRQQMIAASQRAQAIVHELSAKIPDPTQRDSYLKHASDRIAPIPAPTSRQTVKHLFDGLTTREREIAIRIAQGQSNRLIAQELVLSQRTVDAHVSNILSKLGFGSRSQITRWAVEKGLLE